MISIIVAVAANGVIGAQGKMPWHIPEDLRRFRTLTLGHAVIMGRRTFESIGRPLDGRRNVVLTRQAGWRADGVEVAGSLAGALEITAGDGEVFVIGGGEVYREALPLADRIYLTRVDCAPAGDVFFPHIDDGQWREVHTERREGFEFVEYVRIDC